MRAIDRVVTEYVVDATGELRPANSGAWRIEPATGESGLHRALAGLPEQPDALARAASAYGPLRLGTEIVGLIPDAAWDELGVTLGQLALPEWIAVSEWIARGCRGETPAVLAGAMPLIEAISSVPSPVRRYLDLMVEGASPEDLAAVVKEVEADAADWEPEPTMSAMVNGLDAMVGGSTVHGRAMPPGGVGAVRSPCEDESIAWAVRFFLWAQAVLAGQTSPPAGISTTGIVGSAIAAFPDLLRAIKTATDTEDDQILGRLVAHLRAETVQGWLAASQEMRHWVVAVDIRKRAEAGTLRMSDLDDLRSLIPVLLDGTQTGLDGATTPGELIELLAPRLTARLRRHLGTSRAWPYPAHRVVGAFGRALWAIWFEFTDERPPQLCAAAGCGETFPAHGNRRYCDAHRLIRDRRRKQKPGQLRPARALR
jgi:hypothetical protein